MKNSQVSRKPNLGVFQMTCWVLGLVAFVEVMTVGMAVAFRNQRAPAPEERVVKEYVMVPAERRAPVRVVPQKPKKAPELSEADLIAELGPVAEVDEREVLDAPPSILDPVVERLLEDAHDARIRGDLYEAHTKLNEAQLRDPKNPNVLYELGTNYEEFGVFDKAMAFFVEVFKMGPDAGSLYPKAATKIEYGFQAEVKDLGALGWARITSPTRVDGGERRTLILPVSVSMTKDFDPALISPTVTFYEEIDGQVVQAIIQDGGSGSEWVTGTADWKDGEEMAEVWYFVPDQDAATGLLFGDRKFYGFVAELYYDGRLVDQRAHPRTLGSGKRSSTMEDLQRELDELDGLDIEDLRPAGPSVLPEMSLPGSGLPGAGE